MPELESYICEELHLSLRTIPNLSYRLALFGQPDNKVAEDKVILNNGLAHSRNPALIWHDHFRFRHISEVFL